MCTYLVVCLLASNLGVWLAKITPCAFATEQSAAATVLRPATLPVRRHACILARVHACASIRAHAWLHVFHRDPMRKRIRMYV